MDINNLSDHEKTMIAVAENGNPNDPSENKEQSIALPSDELKDGEVEEPKVEEPKVEEPDDDASTDDESTDDETEAPEELTEEQKELHKLREAAKERDVYEAVGGKDNYLKLAEWASTSLPPEQLEVYNQAMNSDDAVVAVFAAEALHARSRWADVEKNGYQGAITQPAGNQAATGTNGYESAAQMSADMRDPRYSKDPAYRNKVMQKVSATPAGII